MNLHPLYRWALLLGVAGAVMFGPARHSAAAASVQRLVLSNRLVVLVAEEHALPFVTLNLLIDAGSRRDPAGKAGLANLTARSLPLGTRQRSESEINEALDFMGSSLNVSCGWDTVAVSLKSLTKELDRSLDIFAEVLTQPAFADAEFRREKDKLLGSITAAGDNPRKQAQLNFRRALFAAGPYGRPLEGTQVTLDALSRSDVLEFYRTFYRPNIGILAIVGDISLEEVKDKLVPRLSGWSPGPVAEGPVETKFAEGPRVLRKSMPISQANIVLGHGGIRRRNPDYYALSVMNRILGGGGSSRLRQAIRVRKGLAYSVHSAFYTHRFPGSFQVALQTKNASAAEAIRIVVQEMRRMQQEPVTAVELETAQKYLAGSFPLRLETQAGLAGFIARSAYYDLGLDYARRYPALIRAVTREDVLRAARQYLYPEKRIVSIVGNLAEIEAGASGGEAR